MTRWVCRLAAEAYALLGVLLIFALAYSEARAQTTPVPIKSCDPSSVLMAGGVRLPLPWGTGSEYLYVETENASGRFVWCPQNPGWNIVAWQWRIKGTKAPAGWDIDEAIERIKKASNPASAVEAEFKAAAVPLAGDLQKYELRKLRHKACMLMTTAPVPLMPLPTGDTLSVFEQRPDGTHWCGVAPVLPTIAEVWLVTKSGTATERLAYKENPDGTKGALDGRARIGATCLCDQRKIVETQFGVTTTLCRVPSTALVPTSTVNHLASCTKQLQ